MGEHREISYPEDEEALFLNLPDPEPRLSGRPEFSIRLANAGVWEPSTGYKSLKASLRVYRSGS